MVTFFVSVGLFHFISLSMVLMLSFLINNSVSDMIVQPALLKLYHVHLTKLCIRVTVATINQVRKRYAEKYQHLNKMTPVTAHSADSCCDICPTSC